MQLINDIYNLIKITEDFVDPHARANSIMGVIHHLQGNHPKKIKSKTTNHKHINPLSPHGLYRKKFGIVDYKRIMKKHNLHNNSLYKPMINSNYR